MSVKKIVCAIDLSSSSHKALARAVELALATNAELHLIHVVSTMYVDEYADSSCSLAEHLKARMFLYSYVKLCAVVDQHIPKSVRYRLTIRDGDPAAEIVGRAEKEGADVIIVGAEKQGHWEQLVSGSIADRVSRLASCPVFTT